MAQVKNKKPATTDKLATTKKDEPKALQTQSMADMFEQNAGAGMENVSQKDLAIPRIGLIQSGSPQVKKGADASKFIKGAAEGDFVDSVANTIIASGDEGFIFIPCSYRRANIEWVLRKNGGGFVADHGPSDDIFQKCVKDEETGAMLINNGRNEVVTTGEFVGIMLDSKGKNPREVVISLAKTAFAASKKLNTYTSTLQVPKQNGQGTFNPPSFYSAFAVTSVPAISKKTGNSYMTWLFTKKCESIELGEGVVQKAFALYKASQMGTLNIAPPEAAQEPETDDSSL